MTCEDVELELSSPEPSEPARAHLASCLGCQETARLLSLAALPAVSDSERAALVGLEQDTVRAWKAEHRRGEAVKRAASLLLAAGLGALIASGLLLNTTPPAVQTVFVSAPEVPVLEMEEDNLSEDEVFFEVGWPSPTEGDL
jgi:hypothetical protein